MPPAKTLLTALAAASLLLACSDDDSDDDTGDDAGTPTTEATTDDAGGGPVEVTVAEGFGEDPTISIEGDEPPTELVTEDLVVGDGEEVAAGASVSVFYEGVLLDGSVFDGNFEAGEPISFSLDGVIAGWTEGIPGMRVGGRRLLVIPSELAYGAQGFPPVIGPDEALVFVVDLVAIG